MTAARFFYRDPDASPADASSAGDARSRAPAAALADAEMHGVYLACEFALVAE